METHTALFTQLKRTRKFPMTCMLAFLYIYIFIFFLNKAWQQLRPRIKITALCHPKARAEAPLCFASPPALLLAQAAPGLAPPEHPLSQLSFRVIHAAIPSDLLWKAPFGRIFKTRHQFLTSLVITCTTHKSIQRRSILGGSIRL